MMNSTVPESDQRPSWRQRAARQDHQVRDEQPRVVRA
jgi:hypothetical protein